MLRRVRACEEQRVGRTFARGQAVEHDALANAVGREDDGLRLHPAQQPLQHERTVGQRLQAPLRRPLQPLKRLAPEPRQNSGQISGLACRSEEHTSELQSLMRISYAVFCLKKKTIK